MRWKKNMLAGAVVAALFAWMLLALAPGAAWAKTVSPGVICSAAPACTTGPTGCNHTLIRVTMSYYEGSGFASPGWVKAKVTNTGGCSVRAEAHCLNVIVHNYYDGNIVTTNGATSEADCQEFDETLDGEQGYKWSSGGNTWTKVDTRDY